MTTLPVHLQANSLATTVFLIVGIVFFIVSLGWAIKQTKQTNSSLPLLALLGGFFASLAEAWIDILIQLWYPANSPFIVFTAMGIAQPIYVHLIYPGFVGLGAYITYLTLKKSDTQTQPSKVPTKALWSIFLGVVIMDLLFECLGTATGAYYYYGSQPFQLISDGWPAWVGPINAAGTMLGGWLIYKIEPILHGTWRVLLALLPPLAYVGTYGATGWPTSMLMNSNAPTSAIWIAASISMGLCFAIIQLMIFSLQHSNQK